MAGLNQSIPVVVMIGATVDAVAAADGGGQWYCCGCLADGGVARAEDFLNQVLCWYRRTWQRNVCVLCVAPTRSRQWRANLPRHRGGRKERTPARWWIVDEVISLWIFCSPVHKLVFILFVAGWRVRFEISRSRVFYVFICIRFGCVSRLRILI